jgi:hypothetical protein
MSYYSADGKKSFGKLEFFSYQQRILDRLTFLMITNGNVRGLVMISDR